MNLPSGGAAWPSHVNGGEHTCPGWPIPQHAIVPSVRMAAAMLRADRYLHQCSRWRRGRATVIDPVAPARHRLVPADRAVALPDTPAKRNLPEVSARDLHIAWDVTPASESTGRENSAGVVGAASRIDERPIRRWPWPRRCKRIHAPMCDRAIVHDGESWLDELRPHRHSDAGIRVAAAVVARIWTGRIHSLRCAVARRTSSSRVAAATIRRSRPVRAPRRAARHGERHSQHQHWGW